MNCMNFNELHELEHLWGGLSACRLWCSSHLASHALKRRKDVMFSCFRCRVRKSRWIFINLNLQIFFPQKKYVYKRYQIIKSPTVQPFCWKVKLQAYISYISYPRKSPLHSATAQLSVKGTSKMWCRPSQCPSCRHALLDQETSHLSNILSKSNLIPQQNPPELIDMLWKLRKVGFDPKLEVKNQGFNCLLTSTLMSFWVGSTLHNGQVRRKLGVVFFCISALHCLAGLNGVFSLHIYMR